VEAASDNLGAVLEPLLLMVLAGIVGAMVLALYMPIFTIFEVVQGQI
jgi:type IV pilus assembly protein PilC